MATEACNNGKVHYLLPILHKADGGQVAKQDILNVEKSKLLPAASLFTLTSDCCHCLAYISFTCRLYLLPPEVKLSRTFFSVRTELWFEALFLTTTVPYTISREHHGASPTLGPLQS